MRLGIVGTGRIAKRMVREIYKVNGINLVGVYNPNISSAEKFAEAIGKRVFSTEKELYRECDIVYIASPHASHYTYAMSALEAGCHVLCEKPMCFSKKQAEDLFAAAEKNNKVLMEAVKTAYCPGFLKLKEVAASGIIGQAKYMDAAFTKLVDASGRELSADQYAGSFYELGTYVLTGALEIFGKDYKEVKIDKILLDEGGADIFSRASLKYADGKMATLVMGLGVKAEGSMTIAGTKGYIQVPAPWWKTSYFEVHYEDASKVDKYEEIYDGDGLEYELEELLTLIEKTEKGSYATGNKELSIGIAGVMEEYR